MVRPLLFALWICVVALASAAAQLLFSKEGDVSIGAKEHGSKTPGALTYFETDLLSTAVVRDGVVRGYVLARLQYAIDEGRSAHGDAFDPSMLVSDAFTSNFASGFEKKVDSYWSPDVDQISEELVARADAIAAEHIIEKILVGQLDFLAKDEARSSSAARREALSAN